MELIKEISRKKTILLKRKKTDIFLEYCDLQQTSFIHTQGNNTMELILSNNPSFISTYKTIVKSKFSGHFCSRFFPITCTTNQQNVERVNILTQLFFNSLT